MKELGAEGAGSTTGQDQYWIEYTTPGGASEGTPGGTPDDGKNEVTITDGSTPLYSSSDLMTASTDIAKEEVPMAQVPKTGNAALYQAKQEKGSIWMES